MLNSFVLFSLLCLLATASSLTSTGSTADIDGISYYLPGKPFAILASSLYGQIQLGANNVGGSLVPVTVIGASSGSLDVAQIEQTIQGFGVEDDVWGTGFLTGRPLPATFCFFLFGFQTFQMRHDKQESEHL